MWKTAFKKFEVIWSSSANHITSTFLKAVSHKFYFADSWILCALYKLFWKPIFDQCCIYLQIKWLVYLWNEILGWNRLIYRNSCSQGSLLIPLKTSENLWFSNVFRRIKWEHWEIQKSTSEKFCTVYRKMLLMESVFSIVAVLWLIIYEGNYHLLKISER